MHLEEQQAPQDIQHAVDQHCAEEQSPLYRITQAPRAHTGNAGGDVDQCPDRAKRPVGRLPCGLDEVVIPGADLGGGATDTADGDRQKKGDEDGFFAGAGELYQSVVIPSRVQAGGPCP